MVEWPSSHSVSQCGSGIEKSAKCPWSGTWAKQLLIQQLKMKNEKRDELSFENISCALISWDEPLCLAGISHARRNLFIVKLGMLKLLELDEKVL